MPGQTPIPGSPEGIPFRKEGAMKDDQEGDFAAGQETEHPEEHRKGDFAEGQEKEHEEHKEGDFAEGQEKEHEEHRKGSFDEGQG